MSAIRELQTALLETETAQFVTTMLRDISATRLQSLRATFEANRAYYAELHGLMAMVQAYAHQNGVVLPSTTGGRVYVAVTSNKRFYGQLNQHVMSQFKAALEEHQSAAGIVIGQTGQQLLARMTFPRPVSTIAFASDAPTPEELKATIAALHNYTEVYVIHPTFINSFRQEPVVTDLTHEPEEKPNLPMLPAVEYICEPDLPALAEFFRTQIRYVLFDRILLETRVALTGARLMKMQRARERAKDLVKVERRNIHRAVTTMESMHLLETFTGFKSDRTL